MNHRETFWALCSVLLVLLLGVYLRNGFQKKNLLFAVWLGAGIAAQFVAYVGVSLRYPAWMKPAHEVSDIASAVLAIAVISVAAARWNCPVNRTLVLGLGGMLAAQIFGMVLSGRIPAFAGMTRHLTDTPLRAWLQNIGFFGPALYMLAIFSGTRIDLIPLPIQRFFAALRMTPSEAAACAPQWLRHAGAAMARSLFNA